jgi:prepilin-type processing-associated H-X9-DG protein
MAFIVSEEQTVEATMDHTHSRGWTRSWENVLRDIQPDRHRTGRPDNDHSKGSANYLFIDGHVETWRASDVKQRIESGENFAEPPNLREDA